MTNLTRHWEHKLVSAREVASEEDISYQLMCKILQKLHNAKLVKSCMGPKGGFRLSRKPSKISLLEIIGAIQGPVTLNRCLLGIDACERQKNCEVSKKLAELQEHIDSYLHGITLDGIFKSSRTKKKNTKNRKRKKR
jgi:Rrf2 family protein